MLFADQAALDKAFDDSVAANSEVLPCPDGGAESPTTWHFNETPDKVEGRLACGTYKASADLTWTKNADLVMGTIQGPNLVDVHNWWMNYRLGDSR